MKMKKDVKKLKLSRETLQVLDLQNLAQAAGGSNTTGWNGTCYSYVCIATTDADHFCTG